MSKNTNPNEESEESILDFIRAELIDEYYHDGDVIYDDPWYDVNQEAGNQEEDN